MSDLEDFELSRGPQSNPGLEVQNDDVGRINDVVQVGVVSNWWLGISTFY